MGGDLLAVSCIVYVASITVFLKYLGSQHNFAIFGSILSVGGSRTGMVPAVLNSRLPLVIGPCRVLHLLL